MDGFVKEVARIIALGNHGVAKRGTGEFQVSSPGV
jgi:hypothetical protein